MSDKKHLGRFCIQLNPTDARHFRVIELLEEQGRRKAQFIAEAVLHYIDDPDNHTDAAINLSQLKSIVAALIKKEMNKEAAPNKDADPMAISLTDKENGALETLDDLDSDLRKAVQDCMTSFRQD